MEEVQGGEEDEGGTRRGRGWRRYKEGKRVKEVQGGEEDEFTVHVKEEDEGTYVRTQLCT